MPRETVLSDVRPYGDDVPAVSGVEVTWDRDTHHVQIGTVCVRPDDGLPFHGAVRVGTGGWVTMSGPGTVSQSTPWDPNGTYVGDTFFPQPSTFDPIPGAQYQTIPMVPLDTGGIDKTGWCDDCRENRHVQCVDDTVEHSASDPDWCRCPCGEIKASLLEETEGRVQVRGTVDGELAEMELVQTDGPGHFVQLNRKQLNELIRHLKRAGRMAFGADEW